METIIKRTDYMPPLYTIDRVDLTFELDPNTTRVTNTMVINQLAKVPLVLNGERLQLVSITLNDKILLETEYELDASTLTLYDVPAHFTLTIVTLIQPANNTTLEGLFISNDIFCTQCEAVGFSKMTYYLDRPDVMSIYSTTIIADQKRYPVLLSNGNLVEEEIYTNGKHLARWEDPFKKPCYLFALVAGNLDSLEDHFITQSGRRITLRIFVEQGKRELCHHAMASLKLAMRWDEEEYGREYDLDIFMIVAVSDFNMGAMENKGLNIFNDKYILADPTMATDHDYEAIQIVVGHEYFHNWTGNRITCRDWFQLSLKEGLTVFRDQEFNADLTSRAIGRIDDVIQLRVAQFPEDAGPLSHPVRPEAYIEVNNFYTATVYQKGAEVIRMLQTLLTPAGFRKGMDLYFTRHDGQAVTCDDYVQALADANNIDLTQFKRWYSQAGTPIITVKTTYLPEQQRYELDLSQHYSDEEQNKKLPLHLPIKIAFIDPTNGKKILCNGKSETLLQLTQPQESFIFTDPIFAELSEPPVLSILRGFTAPIKLKYHRPLHELYTLLQYDDDAFNRWEASQELNYHWLHELINCYYPPHEYHIDEAYFIALTKVLNESAEERALAARILMLPSLLQISEHYKVNQPVEAITITHATLREMLALRLFEDILALYQQLNTHPAYEFTPQAVAMRSLKNTCLYYLVYSGHAQGLQLAIEQYHTANNMTDTLAALQYIVNQNVDIRMGLLQEFYLQWQHNDLVIDKWLSIQATSELPDVLDNIKGLLNHPAFNYKTPNKVRALIGSFAANNYAHFHAMDGSGYAFLAEQVAIVDELNPQVAARIITPLTLWQPQQLLRQELMQQALRTLLARPNLSKNVYEIISKSLDE